MNTVCASELLKFEETAAAALEQASLDDSKQKMSFSSDRSPSPVLSPRGMIPLLFKAISPLLDEPIWHPQCVVIKSSSQLSQFAPIIW